jgi:hypothetical protein
MTRTLPPLVALVLVLLAGLLHGRWARRWEASPAVAEAAARLGRVPMTLGDWEARTVEVDDAQLAAAEIAGHLSRAYRNRRDGSVVTAFLVCGPPGPIAVHTPDVCYAGAGYEVAGAQSRRSLPAGPAGRLAEFMHAELARPAATPVGAASRLDILWAWSADGDWQAPDNPRLAYASQPTLYKLYLIREVDSRAGGDPSRDLLDVLLPELEQALFRGPNTGPKSLARQTTPRAGGGLKRSCRA